jgi:hypothetical protein
MSTLAETLGGLVRDVALARAQADSFSKVLSDQYITDELMRVFPVPRAEIRTVEFDIVFAIQSVESKQINSESVATNVAIAHVDALRDLIMTLPVRRLDSARVTVSLSDRAGSQIQRVLSRYCESQKMPRFRACFGSWPVL